MNKINIKKILALGSLVSVLALSGGTQAFGALETLNENTGFNSVNNSYAAAASVFVDLNQNIEAIANVAAAAVATGGNFVGGNTEGGELSTGVVSLSGGFINDTNVNVVNHTSPLFPDPWAENNTTGAESENNAVTELDSAVSAVNLNDVGLTNTADITAVSGNNVVEANTGVGTADTGAVDGAVSATNVLNSNFLAISSVVDGAMSSAINDTTGADSENNAVVDVDTTVAATSVNTAEILNDIFSVMSSGGNIIDANTGPASLMTGDVASTTDVVNEFNSNETSVEFSAGGPVLSADNGTTGADSTNNAAATATQAVGVTSSNTANVANVVSSTTTSGGNVIEANTGAVDAATGNASSSVLVDNGDTANTNTTNIVLGTGGASVSSSNDTTGAESENNATASLDLDVASVNTNDMSITNVVDTASYTGGNVVDSNTGPVDLATGDSDASASVVNDINNNVTSVTVDSTAEITAENSTTGADSENNATSTVTSDIVLVNTNEAEVVNDVVVESNTGGNVVEANTGSSAVSTGGASLIFDISNTGNSNTTEVTE
ncbi:MAG: hypothetical protein Q8Q48_00465 [Candidatus Staskawiczbacteria bacterium]|nr:hypothetical protein [Candidatus Staskawiczbacteria bacterium]